MLTAAKARYINDGQAINHTPVSAITAGDVIVIGAALVTIALRDIAAGVLGALHVGGLFEAVKDASNIVDGDELYWDADGDPVGGTAGSGAFSNDSSKGPFAGYAIGAAGTTAATVNLYLKSVDVSSAAGPAPAQAVTPDDAESALNTILPDVTAVDVQAVTNDADDFIVLPALANVPIGHTITIPCNAGTNFELRTPADSDEEINSENCDGTKEYLCTDTEVLKVIKINNTIGWMAHAFSALGTAVTAVVPD